MLIKALDEGGLQSGRREPFSCSFMQAQILEELSCNYSELKTELGVRLTPPPPFFARERSERGKDGVVHSLARRTTLFCSRATDGRPSAENPRPARFLHFLKNQLFLRMMHHILHTVRKDLYF